MSRKSRTPDRFLAVWNVVEQVRSPSNWNDGMLEYRNIGSVLHRIEKCHVFDHYSSIPLFHDSIHATYNPRS